MQTYVRIRSDEVDLINKPIEVISQFNVVGGIIPLRIRIEDGDQQLITAKINEIFYANENQYAGIKTLDYGCRVNIGEREQLLELRYHVEAHRWTIRRGIC